MNYTIVLTDQHLQKVMNALGTRPYAEIADVVHEIAMQAQQQSRPQAVLRPEDIPPADAKVN